MERAFDALIQNGFDEFIIVTGYRQQQIVDFLQAHYPTQDITFIYNDRYESTNNIYSLWLTRSYTDGQEILLLDSDIVFDPQIVEKLLHSDKDDILALNRHELGAEEIKVIVDDAQKVVEISKVCSISDAIGESIGIEKMSAEYTKALFRELEIMITTEGLDNIFYERAFESEGPHHPLGAVPLLPDKNMVLSASVSPGAAGGGFLYIWQSFPARRKRQGRRRHPHLKISLDKLRVCANI